MVNSISATPSIAQSFQVQQHQANAPVHKNVQGDKEPQDTVVLSKQATASRDVDHDGDSH
jgi:hypothetical protein